jgi:hypothetical protein
MIARERNKAHSGDLPCHNLTIFTFLDQQQVLDCEPASDRDHQSATRFQLLN